MQKLQKEIEIIGEQNQTLEQDFENEINKKNQNSMEAGQVIDAIQTIYRLCGKIDYARQLRKGGEMTGKSKAFK